jgi:hypothetical protein
MMAQKPTSARGVISLRRRTSRISPAMPAGADGKGSFSDSMMV